MIEKQLKEQLKNKIIHNHYFLVSDEPLLINNTINDIKKSLAIDETFDFESCSIKEIEYADIINKILTAPFASSRRMMVLRELEKENLNDLKEFAHMMNRIPASCCLVMVYQIDKKDGYGYRTDSYKKVLELFPHAQYVLLMPDDVAIQRWITKKMESLGLKNDLQIINYLKEEFADDITGLKNEIQKIENYLYESKQLGIDEVKDISQGLTDVDVYRLADNFFQHRPETLKQFIGLKQYIKTPLPIIDALGRLLCRYASKSCDKSFRYLTGELFRIDTCLKTGSHFADIILEVFFIKNLGMLNKGAHHGK
ncbi:MAG: DNA polymerase III subunit delta [bacterium]